MTPPHTGKKRIRRLGALPERVWLRILTVGLIGGPCAGVGVLIAVFVILGVNSGSGSLTPPLFFLLAALFALFLGAMVGVASAAAALLLFSLVSLFNQSQGAAMVSLGIGGFFGAWPVALWITASILDFGDYGALFAVGTGLIAGVVYALLVRNSTRSPGRSST